jgi:hypothetical protein
MKCLIIDTETIGFKDMSIFDFGYTILDTETGKQESAGFLIDEVYNSPVYKKAYYYEKTKDLYLQYLEEEKISIITVAELKELINRLMLEENIDLFTAYNLPFDLRALNFMLQKHDLRKKNLTHEQINQFAGTLDIATLFGVYESKRGCFKCYCEKNGFLTKTKGIKTDAETVYRYVMNDPTLIEQHTGIDDTKIEATILDYYIQRASKADMEEAHMYTKRGTRTHQLFK